MYNDTREDRDRETATNMVKDLTDSLRRARNLLRKKDKEIANLKLAIEIMSCNYE